MAAPERGTGRIPRVTVVCGRFGSGKTEVAINYALFLSREAERPFLIDLDIVTPYFRTRDRTQELTSQGVAVITPAQVSAQLDTPGITPEILGAIQQGERPVVLDVGGDRQGARVLGRYSAALRERGYTMWFVVNPYRPFTQDLAGIRSSVAEIEASSRLQVTALVSNPNLMEETTTALVEEGHRLIQQAAGELDLPIAFVAVERTLAHQFTDGRLAQSIFPLHRYVRVPWHHAGRPSRDQPGPSPP